MQLFLISAGVNSRVRYSLLDSADGHFSIDSQGGLVTLSKPLDREQKASYSLTVAATDFGTPALQDTAALTVTVAGGTLALYGPNSFFRRFSGHNLR